jgi:hypothetical protein
MIDPREGDGGHITPDRNTRTCLEAMHGVCLLDWKSMRRALILGLALTLIAAGLVPLSPCALFSSKMAECAEVKVQSPCEQMHPHSAGALISRGSDKSCCFTSQAPLPELQFERIAVGPGVPIAVSHDTLALPSTRTYSAPLLVEASSPPSFQSLLCTFLF